MLFEGYTESLPLPATAKAAVLLVSDFHFHGPLGLSYMDRNWPTCGLDAVDDRIDEQCDLFEAAWRRGERPNIHVFLKRADERRRGRLFYDLLLIELEYRLAAASSPHAMTMLVSFLNSQN